MHKDATGRTIHKGDYVAYVVTTGSRAGIKFGIVMKLKEKVVETTRFNSQTQKYDPVTDTDYSLSIVGVEKGWRTKEKWQVQGKKEGKQARLISVDRLDRLIILDPHQMEPDAKEALDREMHERGL